MSELFGTKVKNPTCQFGRPGFVKCSLCGKLYTHLGISRHWDKCPNVVKKGEDIQQWKPTT